MLILHEGGPFIFCVMFQIRRQRVGPLRPFQSRVGGAKEVKTPEIKYTQVWRRCKNCFKSSTKNQTLGRLIIKIQFQSNSQCHRGQTHTSAAPVAAILF